MSSTHKKTLVNSSKLFFFLRRVWSISIIHLFYRFFTLSLPVCFELDPWTFGLVEWSSRFSSMHWVHDLSIPKFLSITKKSFVSNGKSLVHYLKQQRQQKDSYRDTTASKIFVWRFDRQEYLKYDMKDLNLTQVW